MSIRGYNTNMKTSDTGLAAVSLLIWLMLIEIVSAYVGISDE